MKKPLLTEQLLRNVFFDTFALMRDASIYGNASYNPAPEFSKIKTKLFALNFSDDEFNPDRLQILQTVVPKLEHGRYVVQLGTPASPGHYTMTRPDL